MKGLARDLKKLLPRKAIVCSKCGLSGGTLVKVGDLYECQDKEKCAVALFRRR